ncbi:MAG TPA: serine hydrolase domain-containing protein [Nitriliruptorales bacterium]
MVATDENLSDLVAQTREATGVPGLVAGVSRRDHVEVAAAGVRNLNTGDPMTPDTLFLTGSITKVWTTTLALTFVDEGLLELTAPVRHYLPEFRVADAEATAAATVAMLMNHTAGWDSSDLAIDAGEGSAAYRAVLARLATIDQLFPPGRHVSYNNAPWMVLALILEQLAGGTGYHELLRERIFEPCGLERTCTSTDEAILHRTAVGSVLTGPEGQLEATPVMLLPKSMAPAGTTLFTTVGDTLAFLRMHLRSGVADDGTRVLSEEAVSLMQTPSSPRQVPDGPDHRYGLGWHVTTQRGRRLLHHAGGSYGGGAFVTVVPDRDLAYIAYTNSVMSERAIVGLRDAVVGEEFPLVEPPEPAWGQASAPADLDAFVGTYRTLTKDIVVSRDGDALFLREQARAGDFDVDPAYAAGVGRGLDRPVEVAGPDRLGDGTSFLDRDEHGRFTLVKLRNRIARRV